MSFNNQDRINLVTKALVSGVLDGNSLNQWYETIFPFSFMVEAGKVLTELDTVRQYPASTVVQAQTNVANHLQGVVEDVSSLNSAVRLSEVPDTNKTTSVPLSFLSKSFNENLGLPSHSHKQPLDFLKDLDLI